MRRHTHFNRGIRLAVHLAFYKQMFDIGQQDTPHSEKVRRIVYRTARLMGISGPKMLREFIAKD